MHFAVHEERALLARDLARASKHMGTHSNCNQSALSSHLPSLCLCVCDLFWGEICCFHLGFQNRSLEPEITCLRACSDLTVEKLHSSQSNGSWTVPLPGLSLVSSPKGLLPSLSAFLSGVRAQGHCPPHFGAIDCYIISGRRCQKSTLRSVNQ